MNPLNLILPSVVFATVQAREGNSPGQGGSGSSGFLKDVSRFIAPMILFIGGVWMLSLRITGWSLILGLPAIQIGMVLIILSFDNSAKKTFSSGEFQIVKCDNCGDPTAAPLGEVHELCPKCRAEKIKN
jgi:hypothetical protein